LQIFVGTLLATKEITADKNKAVQFPPTVLANKLSVMLLFLFHVSTPFYVGLVFDESP